MFAGSVGLIPKLKVRGVCGYPLRVCHGACCRLISRLCCNLHTDRNDVCTGDRRPGQHLCRLSASKLVRVDHGAPLSRPSGLGQLVRQARIDPISAV
eukprot:2738761-Prymnesium_polylepis.1